MKTARYDCQQFDKTFLKTHILWGPVLIIEKNGFYCIFDEIGYIKWHHIGQTSTSSGFLKFYNF